MGMPMSIHLRGCDLTTTEVEKAVAAAYQVLARMDEIFSTWASGSQVSRLRRGELAISDCDPLVAQAARIGEQATEATRGAFTTALPDADGRPRFDPTGLVKGWAVDLAAAQLRGLPGCRGASTPVVTSWPADITTCHLWVRPPPRGGSASRTPTTAVRSPGSFHSPMGPSPRREPQPEERTFTTRQAASP